MPTVVQFRRGNTVQNNNFTGAAGEISVDTTLNVLRVADGVTSGGFALVGESATQTITNKIYQGTSVSVTGNVIGNYIIGNGSLLTGLPEGYTNSDVATYLSSGTVSTNIYTTAALSATGNITGANLSITASATIAGNLTVNGTTTTVNSNTVTINDKFINVANNASTSTLANGGGLGVGPIGTEYAVLSYDQATNTWDTNIGLAVTGIVSATGNITGGNLSTAGLVTATGTITSSANVVGGNLSTAGLVTATGNIQGGNLRTGGQVSATGAITGGAITGSSLTVGAGTITLGNIVNGNGNGVGNIGSSLNYFNTVFAKATSAQYADLAEMYCADQNYEPGTVLEFGGNQEVTSTTTSHSPATAGVVSTNPSYLMNAALDCNTAVEVALVGRVPCRVVGAIQKGDRLVSSNLPGVATVLDMKYYQPGCIIGKALENYNSETVGIIEIAVGRF